MKKASYETANLSFVLKYVLFAVKKQLRFQEVQDEAALSSRETPSFKGSSPSRASSSRLSGSTVALSVTGKGTNQVEEGFLVFFKHFVCFECRLSTPAKS